MYHVEIDSEAFADVEALPASALAGFAELSAVLEVAPWGGAAYNRRQPDGGMRSLTFGDDARGLAIYLVLEDQRRVVVLRVIWMG